MKQTHFLRKLGFATRKSDEEITVINGEIAEEPVPPVDGGTMELFPERELAKQFRRTAPSTPLRVGGVYEDSYGEESTTEGFRRSSEQMASIFSELEVDETPEQKSRREHRTSLASAIICGGGCDMGEPYNDTMLVLNSRGDDEEASGEYDDQGYSRLPRRSA